MPFYAFENVARKKWSKNCILFDHIYTILWFKVIFLVFLKWEGIENNANANMETLYFGVIRQSAEEEKSAQEKNVANQFDWIFFHVSLLFYQEIEETKILKSRKKFVLDWVSKCILSKSSEQCLFFFAFNFFYFFSKKIVFPKTIIFRI